MSKGRTPPPAVRMIDAPLGTQVAEQDRRYFSEHPDSTLYTRPYIVGETAPDPDPIIRVDVHKIASDIRMRHFIECDQGGRCVVLDFDPGVSMARRARTMRFYGVELGQIERRTPMGRLGLPEDVVPAVHFLVGPDAGFINGHVLVIDGGLTA